MNKMYTQLFLEIAKSTELLAERVMELDHKNNDLKGEATAKIMRDDFSALKEKLQLDGTALSRSEWIKLLSGAMIVSNNIEDQIKTLQKANSGYKLNIIPKLNRIMNETETDEGAQTLANEFFQISEDK